MLTELQALYKAKEELHLAMRNYNLSLQEFIPLSKEAKDKYRPIFSDAIYKCQSN